jgi:DNA polymerase III epsilon subunit-like protein
MGPQTAQPSPGPSGQRPSTECDARILSRLETEPTANRGETWISVDVETSGPTPGVASLLSIGACVVGRRDLAFLVEMRPVIGMGWSGEAEAIHGLTREHLDAHGLEQSEAMARFADWIATLPAVAAGARPVFVGFNAPFDWMFVADYFWRFYGSNPLGISALDIKALYLGRRWPDVTAWAETTRTRIDARDPGVAGAPLTHDALDDARRQAELLERLLADRDRSDG